MLLHDVGMTSMRTAMIAVLSTSMIMMATALSGCASAERPDIAYVSLPTREMQAIFPAEFGRVHAACLKVVRDELLFQPGAIERDDSAGRSRFTAANADGASLRFTLERSRDLASTTVKVFAVNAGATEASADSARDVLARIDSELWPTR